MNLPLPGPLRLAPSFAFVGRSSELATLRALLPRAEGEGRRVALVGGEPGSGKSRLVREFGHEAAAGGAAVLYGSCDAVVNTPYQPFVESLDHLARHADPTELRGVLGASGGELARLLPDLPLRVGDLAPPLAADPETQRHRLHVAVADLLTGVGRRQPVVLMIEDAHWADVPSLHLFRHLVRAGADARVFLVATFRDAETDASPEFSEALADLRRTEGVVRLRLGGLTREDVGEFLRRAAGTDAGRGLEGLAREISDLTEGNPFLLCEVWRTLREMEVLVLEDGRVRLTRPLAELASPESVREVVSQRLSRLGSGTSELLELAAVIGPEFELAVLGAALGADEEELREGLAQAVRSGMIEEVPPLGLGYRFTHELVRRALYDRLPGVRRADLHLRVGEALERMSGGSRSRRVADLAHHFTTAAPVGGSERAVAYSREAAESAMASLAYEEAAARLRTALALGVADERARARVQLQLGTAHHRAGQTTEALACFRAAAALARALDDPESLALAAIGLEDACWRPGIDDEGAVDLLREADIALSSGDSSLRVRLLAGLSRALIFLGERDSAAAVRAEAVEMARRIGDRANLAQGLLRAYWARGTNTLDEVLAMLAEARDLGDELGDIDARAEAAAWRVVIFAVLCELDAAREELGALRPAAEQAGQPFILYVAEQFGCALALCDGRLDEAEAMAERSREWGRLLRGGDTSPPYGLQMFSVRREQGRLAELAPVVRLLAEGDRAAAAWRPGLVALLVELGMEDEARRELRRLRADGLQGLSTNPLGIDALTYLADAATTLGDAEVAALLYPELEGLAGENVVIGHLVACYGAADRYLGMLAATVGAWEAAEQHFERALELNQRMRAPTWLAHTTYEYARMLRARGAPGDRPRAGELLAEAARTAEAVGLRALVPRIKALGASAPRAVELPGGLSPREIAVLRLVARGLSNREIGETLVISEHTAANHVRSILRKTGCANRTEATSYAHRHALVSV